MGTVSASDCAGGKHVCQAKGETQAEVETRSQPTHRPSGNHHKERHCEGLKARGRHGVAFFGGKE